MILVIVLIIILLLILASCLKIVPQAHAYVIERLGAYQGTWSVGFHIKMPIIDKVAKKVILKEQVVDFAPQPVITKDNVTMRIDTCLLYTSIPGIGPARRKALMKYFGSIEKIREADEEELMKAESMNAGSARAVYAYFH